MPEGGRFLPVFCLLVALAAAIAAAQDSRAEQPRDGEKKAEPADPLRFGPVKLGLDALARPEAATNFDLGSFFFSPGDDESRILFRLRPSVAVSPSENFSARVEGQWYAYYDDTDVSLFSLYQGYAEGVLPGVKGVSLKAGRQEFVYGSTFLLGADTFYDGLTFDGAKLSWKPSDALSIDMLGGQYVKKWAGDIGGKLYGIYAAYSPEESLSVQLYGFRDTAGPGAIHVGGDHEVTYSVGTRVVAGLPGEHVSLEIEPVYQFGRKNRDGASLDHIRAFGGHVDLTVDPALGRFPGQLLLSYAFGSGDEDAENGNFKEFHNPNNDTALIGDISVIGDLGGVTAGDVSASGLHVVTVGGGIDVTEKLNVSLDGHWFRADKTPAGMSKDVGIEADLIFAYSFSDSVAVLASVNRFFTGDFFKDAVGSGKDIDYGYLMVQATF